MLKRIERKTCLSKELIVSLVISIAAIVIIIFWGSFEKSIIPVFLFMYVVGYGLYFIYKEKKFQNMDMWNEIEVEVLSVKVIQCVCFSSYRQRQDEDESYKPEVRYRYKDEGTEIISVQYARSYDNLDCNFNFSKQSAFEYVKNVKRSKIIKAFFNPTTKECVLSLSKVKGYGIPYRGYVIIIGLLSYLSYKIYFL